MSRLKAWAWVLQRVSALVLVLLLGTHMAIMHFVDPTAHVSFAGVTVRMQAAFYFFIDWLLLLLALFHGLNGARNVAVDWWPRAERTVNWVLGLVGIVALVYGGIALAAFRA